MRRIGVRGLIALALLVGAFLPGCNRFGVPLFSDNQGEGTAAWNTFVLTTIENVGIALGIRFPSGTGAIPPTLPADRQP